MMPAPSVTAEGSTSASTPPRRRRGSAAVIVLAVVLLVAAAAGFAIKLVDRGSDDSTPNPTGARATAYMSPTGGGTCTAAFPCNDLERALLAVGSGGTVLLTAGTYPGLTAAASDHFDDRSGNVTVQPAPGAKVMLTTLRSAASHVTYKDINANNVFYLDKPARYVDIENLTLSGNDATMLIRSSNVNVVDSTIEGGQIRDGIQIGSQPQVHDITLRNNIIRNFSGGTRTEQHPDCVQVFDATNIQILQNSLSNCYNSGIILSSGSGLGIDNVRIEGNYVQGCLKELQRCGQAVTAVDLREPIAHYVMAVHNTFGRGAVRLGSDLTSSASANIVGYLGMSTCVTSLTSSLIVSYPTGVCKNGTPGQSGGNWLGTVTFTDVQGNNLASTAPVRIPPGSLAGVPAGLGRHGALPAGVVGAGA